MKTEIYLTERARSARALEASERRYKRLLSAVTDYVYTVNLQNGARPETVHGPGCEAVTGYTSRDFTEDPELWWRMVAAEDREAVTLQASRIQKGETPAPLDHRIRHKNGSWRWIRNTPVPRRDDLGQLVGYDGLVSDITERRQAEEERRLSEARFQAILDNSPTVIVLKDLEGRYVVVNRRFEELFGITNAEAAGKTARELFGDETSAALMSHDLQVLVAQAPLQFEEALPHGGGSRTYLSIKFPLRDPAGVVYGTCAIATDITERKAAEQALRESRERLALVIRGSNDGIWDWNLATNEVYFSQRWKQMLGYEDHEIPNHFSSWEGLLHPEDRERCLAQVDAYLAGRIPTYEVEHRLRHKDGTYRWILARGVLLRDGQGRPIRMAGSHVDLTERRAAEEQLLATQLRAAKFESVGTLAAGVAHEVKNPLQVIVMGLDYLERNLSSDEEAVRAVLTDMRDAAGRADLIVRELMHFATPTAVETRREQLNVLVERSLWLVNFELIASRTTVCRHLAADLPAVRVNRQKMEQIFVNLFLNALQAMSSGGHLNVTTRSAWAGEDTALRRPAFNQFKRGQRLVVAEVQDDGPGVPEAIQDRIFDPFFTTKPVGTGTGLGLSVVKKLVELQGGAICVRNAPQGGALATLVLPAEKE